MRIVKTDNINQQRAKLIARGFITRGEACIYLGVSKQKGRSIYDDIEEELIANGKKVSKCGLSVDNFNNYLGMTSEQILNLSKMGL